MATVAVQVQRSAQRFTTNWGWLESRHCFSFGRHYDPANIGFGLLVVSNEDRVLPDTGFDTHGHRDMEIITWVLSGSLVHQDSQGHSGVIYPGLAQRMSAGTGILHSEKNDAWRLDHSAAAGEPVHFVQMWVAPDTAELRPSYEQCDVSAELARGDLVTVASGRPGRDSAIRIAQQGASLHAAQLIGDGAVAVPDAAFAHLFVARGSVRLEGTGDLAAGDAARITDAQGQRVVAGPEGAELLIWQMDSALF